MTNIWTSVNRPPNPFYGQSIIESDTGNWLIYYGANGWRPPWNLPWEEVAQVSVGASGLYSYTGGPNSTASSRTNPTNIGISANLLKGRIYRYDLDAYMYHTAGSGITGSTDLQLGDRSLEVNNLNYDLTKLASRRFWQYNGSNPNTCAYSFAETTRVTVSDNVTKTYDFRGGRDGVSGSSVLQDQTHMQLYDVGSFAGPPPSWVAAVWDSSVWESSVTFWS